MYFNHHIMLRPEKKINSNWLNIILSIALHLHTTQMETRNEKFTVKYRIIQKTKGQAAEYQNGC